VGCQVQPGRVAHCNGVGSAEWERQVDPNLGRAVFGEVGEQSATFSPDRKRIVSASSDTIAKIFQAQIWDAASGKQLAAVQGHSIRQ
jgi:hypothetical protein